MTTQALRRVELFRDLDEREIRQLASLFVEKELVADQIVFREGDQANTFYVVTRGTVVVYRDTIGKPVQLLGRLQNGDFFGEMGLFDDVRRAASARAVVPSTILMISKADLLGFLDGQPAIALKLQMAAARRHSANVAAALELGQRQEVRIRVSHPAKLETIEGSPYRVWVENLSAGGIRLENVPDGWSDHDEVDFRLDCGDGPVPFSGRVAWRRGRAAGIAFSDRSLEHEARIQRTLRFLLDDA